MAYFAVSYTYTADIDEQNRIRPEHRAFLASLDALVASGPLLETDPGRALLLFNAESAEQVESLLNEDPFWKAGQVAEREVLGWNPVIGVFAS